ncbi:hypothetical protein [Corynebacterium hiratae]|uniref:hypothetical protein n=1 Tax=Corynebacterium hiratae TaxID=3139423 RepID=UPI00272DDE86|nr:hypothetical protein [Corynebacterium aurimucosum]
MLAKLSGATIDQTMMPIVAAKATAKTVLFVLKLAWVSSTLTPGMSAGWIERSPEAALAIALRVLLDVVMGDLSPVE